MKYSFRVQGKKKGQCHVILVKNNEKCIYATWRRIVKNRLSLENLMEKATSCKYD